MNEFYECVGMKQFIALKVTLCKLNNFTEPTITKFILPHRLIIIQVDVLRRNLVQLRSFDRFDVCILKNSRGNVVETI